MEGKLSPSRKENHSPAETVNDIEELLAVNHIEEALRPNTDHETEQQVSEKCTESVRGARKHLWK